MKFGNVIPFPIHATSSQFSQLFFLLKPQSAEELLGMLEYGNNNRTQHPTDANAQSSRSHAVFQVFFL